MLKKTYLILLVCFCCNQSYGQSYFNKLYPYNSLVANASSVIELDGGGYLFKSCTFGSYNSLLILRIDANGDTLFTKEYIVNQASFSNGASNSYIKTLDNNYAFVGSIYKNSNRDALFVKLTQNGDTLWTKTYGGSNYDNANIVSQTADSGFVLMGVTQSYSNGAASDFYLIKTDKDGNEQWHRAYGSTLAEDCISGQITLDGGYIMSGIKNSLLYALKTDANGVFEWDRQLPNTAGTGFIKQLEDSTYILVGAKIVTGLGAQACMTKLNKLGGVMWQRNYGDAGDQQFYTVPIVLPDGSMVCAGTSRVGNAYGLLIKTDSAGNQQWLHTYYANPSNDNYVYDVKHTSDGGFILSGYVTNPWLLKLDSVGCEIANCNVGVEEVVMDKEEIKVYPNPATNSLTLALSKGEGMQGVKMYNMFGECVWASSPLLPSRRGAGPKDSYGGGEVNIDVSKLQRGLYVVEVQTEKGIIRKKFVKE